MTTDAALVLLEAASKGAVILTAALIATSLMRRASASARHLVLALSLLAAGAVMPLAALLPEWRVPMLAPLAVSEPGARAASESRSAALRSRPLEPRLRSAEGDKVADAFRDDAAANVSPATPAIAASPRSFGSLLLAVWLLGVVAVLARHALGVAFLSRLRRGAVAISDPRFARQISELSRVLRITRPVELMTSAATAMPLTWGTRRPGVLLPDVARDWSDRQSRMVLHHELAHVARRDCAWQTVATVATALHWFNPAVWIAARRLRAERERACDDLVLDGGTDPYDYAEQLLDVARRYRAPRGLAVAAIAMARPSRLRGRVAAILDQCTPRRRPSRRHRLLAAAVTFALLLPVAAMRPWRSIDADRAHARAAVPGALLPLAPLSALGRLPARPDSLTWTKRMRLGQELRVYTMKSDIQVERSPDLDVHLITIFGPDDGRGPRHHEFAEDERSIEVCPALPAGVRRAPDSGCYPADWDRERTADNTVRTVVRVPDGIMLRVRTHSGAIVADGISWPLAAETVDGEVRIRSAGAVSVNAVGGNVDVALTRTNWIDRQQLKTVSGRITLRLPADGDVEVTMKSSATNPRTNLAIEREWRGPRGRLHTRARLGAGSRRLDAESWTGEITVTRAVSNGRPE